MQNALHNRHLSTSLYSVKQAAIFGYLEVK